MPRPQKNPEPKEEGIEKLEGTGLSRGHIQLVGCPRLLESGQAHPEWRWRNLCHMGFACPQEEFCKLPEQPTKEALASKWGVQETQIAWWHKNHNWDTMRAQAQGLVSEENWQSEAKALYQCQKREVMGQRQRWERLRDLLESMLDRGVVDDQTAKGVRFTREISVGELKVISATLETIDENIARTYGYSRQNLQRQALSQTAGENPVQTKVVKVRHNLSVEVEETSVTHELESNSMPPLELPAGDTVEGIIIE